MIANHKDETRVAEMGENLWAFACYEDGARYLFCGMTIPMTISTLIFNNVNEYPLERPWGRETVRWGTDERY